MLFVDVSLIVNFYEQRIAILTLNVIRQGWSLAPCLSILIVEALNWNIKGAMEACNIVGIFLPRGQAQQVIL